MIAFSKITPGMTLWDVRKADKMSRWRGSKWSTWRVVVQEVDVQNRRVLASWNGNKATWMSERNVTRLRAKKPD